MAKALLTEGMGEGYRGVARCARAELEGRTAASLARRLEAMAAVGTATAPRLLPAPAFRPY
jgi:hypothetical protein